MKINMTPPVSRIEQQYRVSRTTAVQSNSSVSQADQISFSGDATLFAETVRIAKIDLQERLAKSNIDLDKIKEKIENGSYEINTTELADSMMMLNGYYDRGTLIND